MNLVVFKWPVNPPILSTEGRQLYWYPTHDNGMQEIGKSNWAVSAVVFACLSSQSLDTDKLWYWVLSFFPDLWRETTYYQSNSTQNYICTCIIYKNMPPHTWISRYLWNYYINLLSPRSYYLIQNRFEMYLFVFFYYYYITLVFWYWRFF